MRYMLLLAGMVLAMPALADTAGSVLAHYDSSIRKAYVKESKSECLARARRSPDEIVVCGEVDRKDRYRTTRGGSILPSLGIIQSPAEKFHETKALIAASQNNVGIGYTSSITGIKTGYLRGSYKLATKIAAGEDPDSE
jgi:hypothetical protein